MPLDRARTVGQHATGPVRFARLPDGSDGLIRLDLGLRRVAVVAGARHRGQRKNERKEHLGRQIRRLFTTWFAASVAGAAGAAPPA